MLARVNEKDADKRTNAELIANEAARAIRRAGDTCFPSDTLFEAWELKYCIDNDTDRFAWADSLILHLAIMQLYQADLGEPHLDVILRYQEA